MIIRNYQGATFEQNLAMALLESIRNWPGLLFAQYIEDLYGTDDILKVPIPTRMAFVAARSILAENDYILPRNMYTWYSALHLTLSGWLKAEQLKGTHDASVFVQDVQAARAGRPA